MKRKGNVIVMFMLWLQLGILVIYTFLAGLSANFLLGLADKNIPFIGDLLIGFLLGAFTIPASIVVWILKIFGVF